MPGRFFDTNILLYLLSDDGAKADIAEGLLRDGGTVSVQVLNEIANVTQRKFRMSWSQTDEFLLMIREFVTVAYQAVSQPGVPRAGISASDPRDAVRCPLARLPRSGRCAGTWHLR